MAGCRRRGIASQHARIDGTGDPQYRPGGGDPDARVVYAYGDDGNSHHVYDDAAAALAASAVSRVSSGSACSRTVCSAGSRIKLASEVFDVHAEQVHSKHGMVNRFHSNNPGPSVVWM